MVYLSLWGQMDTLALVLFHCLYSLDSQTSDGLSSGEASILGHCFGLFQLLLVRHTHLHTHSHIHKLSRQTVEYSQERPLGCQNLDSKGEEIVFSTNNAGTTRYPHAKEYSGPPPHTISRPKYKI